MKFYDGTSVSGKALAISIWRYENGAVHIATDDFYEIGGERFRLSAEDAQKLGRYLLNME